MNFVFHHHLASRDLHSEVAALGAMLPDLWRMADRRVRAKTGISQQTEELKVKELLRGIEHHLETDRDFHQASLFVEGERQAAELFEAAGLRGGKMRLFAHIAWELALDGALLRTHGTENILEAVQISIRQTPPVALVQAAELHAPKDLSLAPFHRRLNELLIEIAAGPWIEGYAHGLGLARRLNGVRRRVRLAPLEGEDLDRLAEVSETLIEFAVQLAFGPERSIGSRDAAIKSGA